MMRLAWIAGFIAGVNGLQTNDIPEMLHGSRVMTGSVSALDPDLTNCLGEKFHVTQPGPKVMIGLPDTCNPENPGDCELIVSANFDKLENDGPCNDLMIRNVTIQGSSLDQHPSGGSTGVANIDFSILADVGNSPDALGLQVNDVYYDKAGFVGQVAACTISPQIGYYSNPTKHTYRFRTITDNVDCDFELGSHNFKLQFGVVWRGTMVDPPFSPVYANDISFLSIGNVGQTSIGLLCTDDHTAQAAAVLGCDKKQPVMGPYQVRHGPKFPKRHHWR